jgi:hypothetical protein
VLAPETRAAPRQRIGVAVRVAARARTSGIGIVAVGTVGATRAATIAVAILALRAGLIRTGERDERQQHTKTAYDPRGHPAIVHAVRARARDLSRTSPAV